MTPKKLIAKISIAWRKASKRKKRKKRREKEEQNIKKTCNKILVR
jgi:hypothetical protein